MSKVEVPLLPINPAQFDEDQTVPSSSPEGTPRNRIDSGSSSGSGPVKGVRKEITTPLFKEVSQIKLFVGRLFLFLSFAVVAAAVVLTVLFTHWYLFLILATPVMIALSRVIQRPSVDSKDSSTSPLSSPRQHLDARDKAREEARAANKKQDVVPDPVVIQVKTEEPVFAKLQGPLPIDAPVGMVRTDNLCWSVSLLQMILASPGLRKDIERLNKPELDQILQDCDDAKAAGRVVSHTVPDALRQYLHEMSENKNNFSGGQEDITEAFGLLFANSTGLLCCNQDFSTHYELRNEKTYERVKGSLETREGPKEPSELTSGKVEIYSDDLTLGLPVEINQPTTLNKLLYDFMNPSAAGYETARYLESTTGLFGIYRLIESKKEFTTSPNDLSISINRFAWNEAGQKVLARVEIEKDLTIQVPQNSGEEEGLIYNLNSFAVHHGSAYDPTNPKSGHWISVIKTPSGKWVRCDDESVEEISKDQVRWMAGAASFLHFSKAPLAIESSPVRQVESTLSPNPAIASPDSARGGE